MLQSALLEEKSYFHTSLLPYTNLQSVKITLMLHFNSKFENTCYVPEVWDGTQSVHLMKICLACALTQFLIFST